MQQTCQFVYMLYTTILDYVYMQLRHKIFKNRF
jgi:hypothetical protein